MAQPSTTQAKVTAGARSLQIGDEQYLWALVLLEVAALLLLRNTFRRHHGG